MSLAALVDPDALNEWNAANVRARREYAQHPNAWAEVLSRACQPCLDGNHHVCDHDWTGDTCTCHRRQHSIENTGENRL